MLERCHNKQNNLSASLADEKKNTHGSELLWRSIIVWLEAVDNRTDRLLMKHEIVTNYIPCQLKK